MPDHSTESRPRRDGDARIGPAESMGPHSAKSDVIGRVSFWLALSPGFYVIASLLRLPGFG